MNGKSDGEEELEEYEIIERHVVFTRYHNSMGDLGVGAHFEGHVFRRSFLG